MYPKIGDPNLQEEIAVTYSKYKIPKKKKTFDELCFPKTHTLQLPQKFLAAYINPNTPYKKILIYHKIGSGKTCASIQIAEQFKSKRKIYVVLPAFLINGFKNELRSQCTGENYLTNEEREVLSSNDPTHPVYKEIIDKSNVRIDEHYNIYSYNKFIKGLTTKTIKLANALVIIDEVQNMISESGIYYEVLYKRIKKAPADLRLVLMSATPIFDKPTELPLLFNLLIKNEMPMGDDFYGQYLDENDKVKNVDQLKQSIKGYISYFAGAPSYVFPKSTINIIKCPMSNFQLRMYSYIAKIENKEISWIQSDLTNSYYSGTRSCSNFAFPNVTYYSRLEDSDFEMKNLVKYSCKYATIINHIKNIKGTIFIYSNFRKIGGLQSLARALRMNGYSDYATEGAGLNRFAIWSGAQTVGYRDLVRAVFNLKSNDDGSEIKIILGSPAIREGVSLLRLSEIHLVDPCWNWSRINQILGRGIRFCSHKNLPEIKRKVDVYIYLAVHKLLPESTDQKIMNMALTKQIINKRFEKVLKEAAIDCELFKNANMEDEKYECKD
uniref:Helicase ATP-binding domain-containing protein n=1 Tax=viral metagenome TaxID=1070528 RepID=A0A6C0CAE2_9ZZZZ